MEGGRRIAGRGRRFVFWLTASFLIHACTEEAAKRLSGNEGIDLGGVDPDARSVDTGAAEAGADAGAETSTPLELRNPEDIGFGAVALGPGGHPSGSLLVQPRRGTGPAFDPGQHRRRLW